MPTALVLLADDVEELEAIAPIDILRRAGVEVTTASLDLETTVEGRNGVFIVADVPLAQVVADAFDLIVLPGGPGHVALKNHPVVLQLLQEQQLGNRLIGAICAAPTILKTAGILPERYTAHYTVAEELPDIIEEEAVVVDGNTITSRGAGTAIAFGLALARHLTGPEKANEVAADVHYG